MDITNPTLLKLKGILFLALGLISAGMLLWQSPDWTTWMLLSIAVWSFARFYYFAFYVLHEYADSSFKYAGLWDLSLYLLGWKTGRPRKAAGNSIEDDGT